MALSRVEVLPKCHCGAHDGMDIFLVVCSAYLRTFKERYSSIEDFANMFWISIAESR